jgi:hypothetical protein
MTSQSSRQHLIEQLERGSLALFVGADLPSAITGLPSRADLAAELSQRKGLGESLSLAQVAQRVGQAGSRWEFTAFIRDALDSAVKSPQPFHQRIVALAQAHPLETLITTAFDNLLGSAFQDAGVGVNTVVRGSDVGFIRRGRPTLIRLYGDVQQPETLVVTEDDHYGLWRDRDKEDLLDEVRAALRKNTVLFIGYDLADPDFNLLWREVLDRAGRFAMGAYAVWPGLPETEVQMWRDRGITMLESDPLGILAQGVVQAMPANRPKPIFTAAANDRAIVSMDSAGVSEESATIDVERRPETGSVRFKLQTTHLTNLEFEVRAFETPMGEPRAVGQLPWDSHGLIAVLELLELGRSDLERLQPDQVERLQSLGFVRDGRVVPDLLARLGSGLFRALFPGEIGTAFGLGINQARAERDTVALQLRFDQDAVALARYPWELLHDGHRHLLSSGAVELTRYISYPEAVTSMPIAPPWRLLFVAARPKDLGRLPQRAERLAVWDSVAPLAETGKLILERLDPPTYDSLLDQLAVNDYHIIHFDGHGVFARRCPGCATMNYPHEESCRSCAAPLTDVSSRGFLAFEDSAGRADFVSTEAMENIVLTSQVRLAFLSACQSSAIHGASIFGGIGPGFVRAGVPSVVAMQFSVPVHAAVRFAQGFYSALTRGQPLPRAVALGRQRIFRDGDWFIPTLYLRSSDDEGRLFIG